MVAHSNLAWHRGMGSRQVAFTLVLGPPQRRIAEKEDEGICAQRLGRQVAFTLVLGPPQRRIAEKEDEVAVALWWAKGVLLGER